MPKDVLHYDAVGSFLRPEKLKQARQEFLENKISREKLKLVENEAIADLVEKEKQLGLKVVTDGEFRRSYWHLDTFWGFGGIEHTIPEHGYFFHGEETRADSATVSGKIHYVENHPDVQAFSYLKELIKDDDDVTARQSIPAPAQLYVELFRDEHNKKITNEFYPDHKELVADISKAYRELILDLYNHGCRDIKLDDCTWGVIVDDDFWNVFSEDGKYTRDGLQDLYLELNNGALVDLPEDLRITTHICRGNYHSTWASKGGYEPVAAHVFAKENVDAFYLEFDDERSGGFEPLRFVPKGKEVVLGIITSKKPELEDKEELKQRIKEAAKYVDLENLALSTQCGFASTEEGNKLTEEDQEAKIKLVIETAKEVWK
ncbi:Methionine synthase II (cobalamin-independent) [Ligilactobacillus salivarius cp400]|uniref:Methionine synthase II (Cobalamin-independent) n=1 Tax=Ligilactobacillus salivarius cp400 TaxID=1273133 RepID=V6DIA6_9LACO|nr:Methionine synthase II (cobalamin-independent) [Ligilactobacillus salivarius cp400]